MSYTNWRGLSQRKKEFYKQLGNEIQCLQSELDVRRVISVSRAKVMQSQTWNILRKFENYWDKNGI
jgi:hypothetical protein